MRLLEHFAFAASSNVLVVIAMERVYTLHRPLFVRTYMHLSTQLNSTLQTRQVTVAHLWCLIALAYTVALVVSLPQWSAWTVYYPVEHWGQCVDVWQMRAYMAGASKQLNVAQIVTESKMYLIYSTVVMFWAPATVILVSCCV